MVMSKKAKKAKKEAKLAKKAAKKTAIRKKKKVRKTTDSWKKKEWYSVEHFLKTQRTWRNWGIGMVIAYIILFLVLAIIGTSSGSEATVLTY